MTDSLKVGDIVRFKSGGYRMTVEKIQDQIAFCIWHDNQGHCQRSSFSFEVLTLRATYTPAPADTHAPKFKDPFKGFSDPSPFAPFGHQADQDDSKGPF